MRGTYDFKDGEESPTQAIENNTARTNQGHPHPQPHKPLSDDGDGINDNGTGRVKAILQRREKDGDDSKPITNVKHDRHDSPDDGDGDGDGDGPHHTRTLSRPQPLEIPKSDEGTHPHPHLQSAKGCSGAWVASTGFVGALIASLFGYSNDN